MTLPRIAITMGDPSGVGPEVVVKSLAHAEVRALCRPVVIGDAQRLHDAARICGISSAVLEESECVDLNNVAYDLPWGKLSAAAGDAAFQYVKRATEMAMRGEAGAICTAPLNKEAMQAAGHMYPGHTELLAELTGTPEVSMLLMTGSLRVIHVTTHMGLLDAIERIDAGLVERTIRRGAEVLKRVGLVRRKIGVCGINPHAGEHGLFGRGEEQIKIMPAIAACRARGIDLEGPLPADTLFYRARRGDFGMVVAMYHDQGHGPVKVLGLESGVNITVGLPVIRTSVDHGTAFDIAGTGRADERSLLEAIRQAAALAVPQPSREKME